MDFMISFSVCCVVCREKKLIPPTSLGPRDLSCIKLAKSFSNLAFSYPGRPKKVGSELFTLYESR